MGGILSCLIALISHITRKIFSVGEQKRKNSKMFVKDLWSRYQEDLNYLVVFVLNVLEFHQNV